jgi:hypothetical protein
MISVATTTSHLIASTRRTGMSHQPQYSQGGPQNGPAYPGQPNEKIGATVQGGVPQSGREMPSGYAVADHRLRLGSQICLLIAAISVLLPWALSMAQNWKLGADPLDRTIGLFTLTGFASLVILIGGIVMGRISSKRLSGQQIDLVMFGTGLLAAVVCAAGQHPLNAANKSAIGSSICLLACAIACGLALASAWKKPVPLIMGSGLLFAGSFMPWWSFTMRSPRQAELEFNLADVDPPGDAVHRVAESMGNWVIDTWKIGRLSRPGGHVVDPHYFRAALYGVMLWPGKCGIVVALVVLVLLAVKLPDRTRLLWVGGSALVTSLWMLLWMALSPGENVEPVIQQGLSIFALVPLIGAGLLVFYSFASPLVRRRAND